MKNVVLKKIITLFLYLMVGFAIFLLLRGHNHPGGGFIAGIIASAGFLLYGIVFGSDAILKKLGVNLRHITGIGLTLSFVSALLPMLLGKPPLTALWTDLPFTPDLSLTIGTPLLFDTGVFMVVLGIILTIVTNIMEELKWNS